jgi:hypothetical protein
VEWLRLEHGILSHGQYFTAFEIHSPSLVFFTYTSLSQRTPAGERVLSKARVYAKLVPEVTQMQVATMRSTFFAVYSVRK